MITYIQHPPHACTNSPGYRIRWNLWNMPKYTVETLQYPPRHRWLHQMPNHKTYEGTQYYLTPTRNISYKNIPGGMVKDERMHLCRNIRSTLWTSQSMFTVALPLIFWSLPFPYTLHNRILTSKLKNHKRNSGKERKRGPNIKSKDHMTYGGGI